MAFEDKVLDEMRKAVRGCPNKAELLRSLGKIMEKPLTKKALYDFIGGSKPKVETLNALCTALELDPDTGLKLGQHLEGNNAETPIPVLGYVTAGPPSSPGESVTINDAIGKIEIPNSAWRMMFPKHDRRNIVALRVAGDSMAPRHHDGDVIFVRRTEDTSSIRDGQQVILWLEGEGYTFKVWRDTDILESVNPAFKPRTMPKGSRLWGIYVCGTKSE